MKKKLGNIPRSGNGLRKLFCVMKLTVFLLFVCTFSATASLYSQNNIVSLRLKDASLEEAIRSLKRQTELGFFYNVDNEQIRQVKGINIKVKDALLEDALTSILEGTKLSWSIVNNVVIIKTKEESTFIPQKTKQIRGQVKDLDGAALPGVNIVIKNTTLGTTTNSDGHFTIQVPDNPESTLVFSFIGMRKVEVKCDKEFINVRMESLIEQLAEIIINTGYQKIDRRMSSSSVFSIKADEILDANALTLDNMLMGKIPGLTVLNSSSTPGAATKIRIRGSSTISGNREPLWVVDGVILEDPVPISTEELNSLDNVNLIGNAISNLNPQDIERIDILKDASSTAIYGVRAANGVIVVTTKKGRKGKPQVNYNGTFTITERPSYNKLHLMNSKERIDVSKEIEERGLSYAFAPARVGYEGALYDWYDRKISYAEFQQRVKQLEENNTDWFDLLYRNSFTHKHNLSISGGSDLINYYFSLGYAKDQSNVRNSNVEQLNTSMKLIANFSEKLSATLQLRTARSEKKYPHSSIAPYEYAYNTSRTIPAYNQDGSLSFYPKEVGYLNDPLGFNILNEFDNSGKDISNNSFNLTTNVEWKILPGLRATGTFALSTSNTEEEEWFSDKSYLAAKLRRVNRTTDLPTESAWREQMCSLPYGGLLDNNNTRNFGYTGRAQLDYRLLLNEKHEFTVVGGTEIRSTKYDGIRTKQWGYLPDRGKKFAEIKFSEWPKYTEMVENNPNIVTDRLSNYASFFGIMTYVYDYRYIFNFNIRADGSNKFGQDKSTRFLPIWSVSGKWNIHNESFFKDVMWMNELALRGSFGIQGNVSDDQTPNLIVKLGSLDALSGQYISTLSKLPNPFLKWEKTSSYDLALDFSFLKNRISGTIEYYYKKGKDQIINKGVSKTTGMSSMSLNVGTIMNKGYELIINAIPVKTKDFTWSLSVNGAKNINRVSETDLNTNYGYNEYLNGSIIFPGRAINSFFSYKFDKLNEQGFPLFKDIEETEGISRDEMYAKVFGYSGNRVPDIQGGISTMFTYKNISLGLFFSYSLGSHIRLNNLYSDAGQQLPQPQQNMSDEFVNRWRKSGDESWAVIPTLSSETLGMTGGIFEEKRDIVIADNRWQMYNKSDLRIVSGDFLRLRNAYIRYTLPQDICKKTCFKTASIRIEGSNLALFASKKLRGQDPEQLTLGGPTTPPVSTFSLGLDVTF